MKNKILTAALAIFCIACSNTQKSVNNTPVLSLNIQRYLGTWYEIARYDHSFERGLNTCKAQYRLRDDGKIDVTNTGIKNGKTDIAHGKAKKTDNPAILKVSFFGPFYSEYRVLSIDPDYQHALIGGSKDKHLWILSRKPQIEDIEKNKLLEEAQRRGYDTSKLIWVNQSNNKVNH